MYTVKEKFTFILKRYPQVFRGRKWDKNKFYAVYSKVEPQKFRVFCSKDNILHYIVITYLVKSGKYLDLDFFDINRICDIYLNNDEDYQCLSSIKSSLLVINISYGVPNRQKCNMLLQLIEQQRMNGDSIIIYYDGTRGSFLQEYSELSKYSSDIVEMGSRAVEQDLI